MSSKTLKRVPYYLLLTMLATGASLILAMLSFGGMYAFLPIFPVAIGAFVLSGAYEGEIYFQNIRGALNKLLLTPNYLQHHLAKEFLKNNFPTHADRPQFFNDYEQQLRLLQEFEYNEKDEHKHLSPSAQKRKKQIEQTLQNLEILFSNQLFLRKKNKAKNPNEKLPPHVLELQTWLDQQATQSIEKTLAFRRKLFYAMAGLSVLSAIFMGFGTPYLLGETFAVIPLLSLLPLSATPAVVIVLAAIAGTAYGLLTYNAVTDMINNRTMQNLWGKLKQIKTDGLSLRTVIMTLITVTLVGLAVTLTVCTAGTWWTIAKQSEPLLGFINKMPGFIMGIVNPIINGISSLAFNWQNTAETLEMIEEVKWQPFKWLKEAWEWIGEKGKQVAEQENSLQQLNPARIILKLTIMPLRIILFLGHLISIGVTGDRVPGIPQIVSALLGIISEGFEDGHYFFGHSHHHHEHDAKKGHHHHHHHDHDHHHGHHHGQKQDQQEDVDTSTTPSEETATKPPIDLKPLLNQRLGAGHGHNHDTDIPTIVLKYVVFQPVYLLAALWDFTASKFNAGTTSRKKLSWSDAWRKQMGKPIDEDVAPEAADAHAPLSPWQLESLRLNIQNYIDEHFSFTLLHRDTAKLKKTKLIALQEKLNDVKSTAQLNQAIHETLNEREHGKPVIKQHRFFNSEKPTSTQTFLTELTTELKGASVA